MRLPHHSILYDGREIGIRPSCVSYAFLWLFQYLVVEVKQFLAGRLLGKALDAPESRRAQALA
jgi:hypothetical protein